MPREKEKSMIERKNKAANNDEEEEEEEKPKTRKTDEENEDGKQIIDTKICEMIETPQKGES